MDNFICIENKRFLLKLDEDCVVKSLILKENGEESIVNVEDIPLFSLTEERLFNNELKLAHPNKKITFNANSVVRDGNKLVVGFELISVKAVVEIKETDAYISFKLSEYITGDEYIPLAMDMPPVYEFNLLQLPIKHREKFGDWLNVSWDDKVCVNVLSTSPTAIIDNQSFKNYRILTAKAHRDIELLGCEAALIVSNPAEFMDCVKVLENDYDLPKGVESRRREDINNSIYWTNDINPANVDEHIEIAKKGGFTKILIYYVAFFGEEGSYNFCNDCNYTDNYKYGDADVKFVFDKIREAGIISGIHILHSHIGVKTHYVTPVADYRLNLTKHFTLSKSLGIDDTTVYVAQNPKGSVMNEQCRVLFFDGELIHYDSYSTEKPYCFIGCKRGYFDTNVVSHKEGTIGGIIDISEFCAESIYIDQSTDLQDEIAETLAHLYNLGAEFVYFDGSEGTDAPYEYEIPLAQYRVYKQLKNAPLFCEGAAKAHFSWHMLSGGNAFDIFPTNIFKKSIAKFPLEEAPRMAENFTRLNFGWWKFYDDTQADVYEYGTSKASSWNCPVTVMIDIDTVKSHPRCNDILEVMRRWEDVRKFNILSTEQKEMLKNPNQEYTLIIDENGEYKLVPYDKIDGTLDVVSAFVFEHEGKNHVVCWHNNSYGNLQIPLKNCEFDYKNEFNGNDIPVKSEGETSIIKLENKAYLSTNLEKEKLISAFRNAKFIIS